MEQGAVISVVVAILAGISVPMTSHNTQGRILRGTKGISGAEEIFLLEAPFGMITPTTAIGARLRVVSAGALQLLDRSKEGNLHLNRVDLHGKFYAHGKFSFRTLR